jgi:hypothetical protein
VRGLEGPPEERREHARTSRRGEREQRLCRLVPGVEREVEGAPVNGEQRAAAEERQRLECVGRTEVDVAPGRVPGADLEHHQIEGREPRTNRGKLGCEPGVSGKEHAAVLGSDHPRRPQGGIPIGERAAREVLCGRGRERQRAAGQGVFLPPVELDDQVRIDAEPLQSSTDAERRHDRHP